MNILFFASDYNIGLSSLLTDQLLALHNLGSNVLAVSGDKEQECGLRTKLEGQNVPLIIINELDEHANFSYLSKVLSELILKNDINTIHVQNNWQLALITSVRFRLICKKRLKVIYTLHGFRHNSKIKSVVAQILIGTALFLFANKVICMCSYLRNKFKFISYKIVLLPLGVSDNFFTKTHQELPHNGLQMIFPAQFRKGKNQDIIINAFAQHIKENHDNVSHLILPGTGQLLEKMKDLAKSLNIENRVTFPGQCTKEEIYNLYLKCNIGIISSNSETFGQSIVESFVLGRCVISTPVGIAKDIIINYKTGFLYNTEEELSNILSMLYKNPDSIQKIGLTNYSLRNQFEWETVIKKYLDIVLD
ncbi:MAG TPA: glycosyltransferase family 4 protein [Candidatus Coprenecus stercoravium]|uniref:Glycosyltransferase family 4 protein n=1 Tax=Candidatus Coprenecus stercoravium TaxID=2840735 RepID=A0A9D2GP18_9BACT|nr:glycosyltransferase family 4 protein [Candidatus Coprenecus stercoravium]